MEEIFKYRAGILAQLDKCLTAKTDNRWQADVYNRLREFTTGGKLIRGCLVMYIAEIFGNSNEGDTYFLATALELTQSAFLIHDDIMDQDELRRGNPSLHVQYQRLLKDNHRINWQHDGVSMAICAGDAAIFLAYQQISQLAVNEKVKARIYAQLSSEWQRVCFGQMADIWLTGHDASADKQEILDMYRDKTARYTFSLPMVCGALIERQPNSVLNSLDKLGEKIGLIFQLRDDELDLLGSDEREHKQTYWRAVNFDKREVYELMKKLESDAKALITKLPISEKQKGELIELVVFVKTRSK